MTPDQVEFVAQAFYAAEYPDEWSEAPESLRETYRNLARTAVTLLNQQLPHDSSSAMMTNVTESVRRMGAVQLLS